ncbi:site-2 protease family protein [Solemya velesiana gill symbiont]|uniref:Site-2 protease family protein n=1 Tax=Solemya velesiana gill symbiont TaxID=1918948 RepID=A0A1T2KUF6_9GAMM|nr:site-2 protease family protein [Solemya velesiana gill symbiont]OOZ36487.1 site-2 protease family protein [Solemya velesiana gill symbiont]
MNDLTTIQQIAVLALPLLFAITAHEAAHGWVAKILGDSTASMLGRVTFNPLRHIDPIGTILVPIVMYVSSSMLTGGQPFLFGWAKPVPVDWRNLGNPRRDMALVALAGPMANLIMAIFWALMLKIGVSLESGLAWIALPLYYMGIFGIFINSILMILNLLPILPLDGGRILTSMLPPRLAMNYAKLEPWGLVIVIALLVSGLLGTILTPGIKFVQTLSATLVGLN